jgi:hypothetical protein
MKKLFISVLLVLVYSALALAATEDVSVTALEEGTVLVVQSIDGGSVMELMEVRDGKLVLVDSLRYVRKSELGGEYVIEFQHVKKITEK